MIDTIRGLAERHGPGRGRIAMAGSKINLVTRMIAAHPARYIERSSLTLEGHPWFPRTFLRKCSRVKTRIAFVLALFFLS